MNLSRQDQDELWTAIGSGAPGLDRFYHVNDKLLGEPQHIRSIAMRLVRLLIESLSLPRSLAVLCLASWPLTDSLSFAPSAAQVRRTGPMVQLPIKPLRADGALVTLGEALELLGVERGRLVRVQGVCPPLDAPLFELQRTMSHPDNFLYCTLVG